MQGAQSFSVESDVKFEWTSLTVSATNLTTNAVAFASPISLQVIDGGQNRNVFNRSTPFVNIGGGFSTATTAGGRQLPIPKIFLPDSTITVVANNYDSAINYGNIEATFIGRKIYNFSNRPVGRVWRGNNNKYYTEDYYAYTLYASTVAFGASNVLIEQLIEGDADFEANQISNSAFPRGTTTGAPVVSSQLQAILLDGGKQRPLTSSAATLVNMSGIFGFPLIMPMSHIFKSKSKIQLLVNNIDSADAYNSFYFTIDGRKIYEVPN